MTLLPVLLLPTMVDAATPESRPMGNSPVEAAVPAPIDLRCDLRCNPVGVDEDPLLLSWQVPAAWRGIRQTAYQIQVGTDVPALLDGRLVWDSGIVAKDRSVGVTYAGPRPDRLQRAVWRVRVWCGGEKASAWSKPAIWTEGMGRNPWPGDWIAARTGSPPPPAPAANGARHQAPPVDPHGAAVYMRRTFTVAKPVRRAVLAVCGLGYAAVSIDGQTVGDEVLDPPFSRYDQRTYYSLHEIGRFLTPGKHCLGVVLGHGFFHLLIPDLFQNEKAPWRTPPKLLLHLRMEHDDGSVATVDSDAAWRWSEGEETFACIRGGIDVDLRRRMPGWDTPANQEDSRWNPVMKAEPVAGRLTVRDLPPMRVTERLPAKRIWSPRPGVHVADFGREITGWVEAAISAPSGTTVTVEHDLKLDSSGRDLRPPEAWPASHTFGRFQTHRFTAAGNGREIFRPRFTYQGFRYVRLSGLAQTPDSADLVACMVTTDLAGRGVLRCSDPRVERLAAACRRTLLLCAHGIPGEEPTREKMGWNLDNYGPMEGYLAFFGADAACLYRKCQRDILDSQRRDGHIPSIAPDRGWGYYENPSSCNDPWWGAALSEITDRLGRWTGDASALARGDARAADYLAWMAKIADAEGQVKWGLGDWLEPGALPGKVIYTPVPCTSTAGYAHLLGAAADRARSMGEGERAKRFADESERVTAAWLKRWTDPASGRLLRGSQTAPGLALHFGLVADSQRAAAAKGLQAELAACERQISAGFIGSIPVMESLARIDPELAWDAFTSTGRRSGWFHRLAGDEPSLTESLEPSGHGIAPHPYGAYIGGWLFAHVAGIAPDRETMAFRRSRIAPLTTVTGLTSGGGLVETPYGKIETDWQRKDGKVVLTVDVPGNAEAEVHVPLTDPKAIHESGRPLSADAVRIIDGGCRILVGAGKWRFVWPAPVGRQN